MKVMHGQQQPSGIVDDDAPLTAPPPRCMLHPTGTFRTAWDIHVFCYVIYIAFAYPFYLSFNVSTSREMQILDWIIDITFGIDILLNFNTGYVTHEVVIVRRDLVARNYLRTWFVLDFMSTVPLEMILGPSFSDFNAAKVLKIGKLFRGLKMLRISKLVKLISSSGFSEIIEEFMVSLYAKVLIDFVRIVGLSFIICHFMACFMALSGDGFLEQYMVYYDEECCTALGDDICYDDQCRLSAADWPTSRKYLTSMYWAMTTMATVGYGDITPQTDAERVYAMMATGIGCVFFSYVIGIIAGLVAATDANARAYEEKMAVVNAWLNFNHLPKSLRRKVRNYFKSFLQERTALDEQAILNDLDPGLRQELGSYLTPAVIRHSSLFGDLSPTILGKVNPILRPVSVAVNDVVQRENHTGTSMHVVVSGELALYQAARGSSGKGPTAEDHHVVLGPGETFGELVALSVIPRYEFTAVALKPSALYEFDQVHLFEALSSMPEVIEKLRTVAIKRRRTIREKMSSNVNAPPAAAPVTEEEENISPVSTPQIGDQARRLVGGSTLVGGGSSTLPVGYADTVLDKLCGLDSSLRDISRRLKKLEDRHDGDESPSGRVALRSTTTTAEAFPPTTGVSRAEKAVE